MVTEMLTTLTWDLSLLLFIGLLIGVNTFATPQRRGCEGINTGILVP